MQERQVADVESMADIFFYCSGKCGSSHWDLSKYITSRLVSVCFKPGFNQPKDKDMGTKPCDPDTVLDAVFQALKTMEWLRHFDLQQGCQTQLTRFHCSFTL